MKAIRLILILIASLLTACHLISCGTAPPDADFNAMRKQLIDNITSHPLMPLLMLCLFMVSCTLGPTAMLPNGVKITTGGSVATKSSSKANIAEAVMPDGTKIRLVETTTNVDETSAPGAYFLTKTTLGTAKIAGHSADVKEQQGTAKAANARAPTVLTGADGSQSVAQPATASIPSIK